MGESRASERTSELATRNENKTSRRAVGETVSKTKRDEFLNYGLLRLFRANRNETDEERRGCEMSGADGSGGGGVEWPARTAYD